MYHIINFMTFWQADRNKLDIFFRNAHAVIKNNRPMMGIICTTSLSLLPNTTSVLKKIHFFLSGKRWSGLVNIHNSPDWMSSKKFFIFRHQNPKLVYIKIQDPEWLVTLHSHRPSAIRICNSKIDPGVKLVGTE